MIELVVTNYHTPHDLARFCRSLFLQPPKVDWQLSIVNCAAAQADVDMTVAIGKEFVDAGYGTQIRWHNSSTNLGYARACNLAASRAVGPYDYLGFFNADVALTPGAIDGCVAAFDANPSWGVLGPRQVDDVGRITHAGIFGTPEKPKHRGWRVPDRPEYADVREAVTVSGAAYFVRRTAWDALTGCAIYRKSAPGALGAFLPTPHYFEETFLSYHAWSHDWKVMYYGPVTVIHTWHKASPLGGWADEQYPISQALFRAACDDHEIAHD